MGIRDKEIARIEKYAAGLGIKIEWKVYKRGDPEAEWHNDGTKITVYRWTRQSKTSLILALVHELAHHRGWIAANRKEDAEVTAALEADANWVKGQPPISKGHRYLIWLTEKNDAKLQDAVFHDLDLKIPRYKFLATRRVDMWYYFQFYITGKRPPVKVYTKMSRHFEKQYRRRYASNKTQNQA